MISLLMFQNKEKSRKNNREKNHLYQCLKSIFSNFSCMFLFFFQYELYCPNLLDKRNLQEQVKKTLCYQKLLWPFTVLFIVISKNLQILGLQPRSFSRSLEQFFLTVGQNNFGNKIPGFSGCDFGKRYAKPTLVQLNKH